MSPGPVHTQKLHGKLPQKFSFSGFFFYYHIYILNEYKKKHALYLAASISVGYVWQETVAERPPRSVVRTKKIAPQEKLKDIAPISDKIVQAISHPVTR